MARFQFVSPGAAFTDELTKVLAERKIEQRQAMLDELTRKAEERQEREAQNMAAYREAQMKSQALQDKISRLNVVTAGLRPSSDLSGISPDNMSLLREFNQLMPGKPVGAPSVSTTESFAPTTADTTIEGATQTEPVVTQEPAPVTPAERYRGTAQQQEIEERKNRLGDLIGGMLADPKRAEAGQFLAMLAANSPDGVLPVEAYKMAGVTPKEQARVFNPEKGTFRGAVDEKGPIMDVPGTTYQMNPYHAPASMQGWDHILTTPEGYPIFADKFGNTKVNESFAGRVPGSESFGLSPTLIRDHNRLAGIVRMEKGGVLSGGPKPPDPGITQSFKASAMSLAGNAKVSSPVKRLVMQYIDNPWIFERMLDITPLTEQEVSQLEELKNMVAPTSEIDQVLRATSPKPKIKGEPTGTTPVKGSRAPRG